MSDKLAIELASYLRLNSRQDFMRKQLALRREVRWIHQRKKPLKAYREVAELGWTLEQLEAICVVAAFEQVVLGPARAAVRPGEPSRGGLIYEFPVLAGSFRLDGETAARMGEMLTNFDALTNRLGLGRSPSNVLRAPTGNDLVYRLSKSVTAW